MKTTSAFLLLVLCCVTSARGQTLDWTRQLGIGGDQKSSAVSADVLGNVYMSGWIEDSLGEPNAFITRYDASGTQEWTQKLGGTSSIDGSGAVSADGLGNVYISGTTEGSLWGPSAGGHDAFINKYDVSGTLQWSRQLGTSSVDLGRSVSADGLGNVYISGETRGSLGGRSPVD